MGVYQDQVVPRVINAACGSKNLHELRERVCADLAGDVVEIGFGSGLNAPHYPDAVALVDAVDPSDTGWRMAAKRLSQTQVTVRRAGLDGQQLPFADRTYDAALSTWTLCTIPDARAALLELHRVLKPGGRLHFVEHGLSPDEKVQRFQRRIEPVHRRVFGGCLVTRNVVDMLVAAGFTVTDVEHFYEKRAPKYAGASSLGVAVAA
jgi:ubiquinone/menaquinone biosynthesis C-methylase UbiE